MSTHDAILRDPRRSSSTAAWRRRGGASPASAVTRGSCPRPSPGAEARGLRPATSTRSRTPRPSARPDITANDPGDRRPRRQRLADAPSTRGPRRRPRRAAWRSDGSLEVLSPAHSLAASAALGFRHSSVKVMAMASVGRRAGTLTCVRTTAARGRAVGMAAIPTSPAGAAPPGGCLLDSRAGSGDRRVHPSPRRAGSACARCARARSTQSGPARLRRQRRGWVPPCACASDLATGSADDADLGRSSTRWRSRIDSTAARNRRGDRDADDGVVAWSRRTALGRRSLLADPRRPRPRHPATTVRPVARRGARRFGRSPSSHPRRAPGCGRRPRIVRRLATRWPSAALSAVVDDVNAAGRPIASTPLVPWRCSSLPRPGRGGAPFIRRPAVGAAARAAVRGAAGRANEQASAYVRQLRAAGGGVVGAGCRSRRGRRPR